MLDTSRFAWRFAPLAPLSLAAFCALLVACGNGGASEPPVTSYDPAATSKLQFAVGIATISYEGGAKVAYGLNTVETLRQKDGLSGTLYNVPMIIGPTHFSVTTSTVTGNGVQDAGSDTGTDHITWATLNQSAWTTSPRGPKEPTTGAFGYGLCPCNSDAGPGNGFTPLYQAFYSPIYGDLLATDEPLWYGGPPAFPAEGPSVVALGWEGYSLGFTDFALQPVVGTYRMYAAVPPSYDTPQNPTPSPGPNGTPTPPPGILAGAAQLADTRPLTPFPLPGFKPDGKGGGTVLLDVPADVTEALAVVDALGGGVGACGYSRTGSTFYTVVTRKTGKQGVNLPDNLGPETGSYQKTPTICPGESFWIYAVGANYPIYESSYPKNLAQLPQIKGTDGQANITTSAIATPSPYPTSKP